MRGLPPFDLLIASAKNPKIAVYSWTIDFSKFLEAAVNVPPLI
jgi:hypothetical protein